MSKHKTLPKETLLELKHIRDEYARAALTGLLATGNGGSADAVEEAFSIANRCMEERDK